MVANLGGAAENRKSRKLCRRGPRQLESADDPLEKVR